MSSAANARSRDCRIQSKTGFARKNPVDCRGTESPHSQHLQPCSKSSQANVTPSIKEPATCRSSSTHAAPSNTLALFTRSQDHLATQGLPQRRSKAASRRGRDQSHLRRDGLGDDAGQSRRPRAPAHITRHRRDSTPRRAGFGESTDAFPLPKGYSLNPDLQAHPHASSEIGIGSEDPMKGPQK